MSAAQTDVQSPHKSAQEISDQTLSCREVKIKQINPFSRYKIQQQYTGGVANMQYQVDSVAWLKSNNTLIRQSNYDTRYDQTSWSTITSVYVAFLFSSIV